MKGENLILLKAVLKYEELWTLETGSFIVGSNLLWCRMEVGRVTLMKLLTVILYVDVQRPCKIIHDSNIYVHYNICDIVL